MRGINNPLFGRTGLNSHMTKYIVTATNLVTKEQMTLIGHKQMKELGFNPAHVLSCAKKERKTHKKHILNFKEKLYEPFR
jgi:hypothetical protein